MAVGPRCLRCLILMSSGQVDLLFLINSSSVKIWSMLILRSVVCSFAFPAYSSVDAFGRVSDDVSELFYEVVSYFLVRRGCLLIERQGAVRSCYCSSVHQSVYGRP